MKITSPIPFPPGLKTHGLPVEQKKQTGAGPAGDAQLKKTCRDLESVFLNMVLSKMRESVPKSDLMGSSRGEDLYRGMMDEELSKQMAAGGGVGLADVLYAQLAPKIAAKTGQGPPGETPDPAP